MADSKQILVIDDEKDIAEIYVQLASSIVDAKVFNANTPSEAYMRSIVQKFDLIIADHRMPKTTGADLIKGIRGQKLNSQVPVIMVTGYPEEVVDLMSTVPNVKIVPKPFQADLLLKIIEKMISSSTLADSKKPHFDLAVLNEFIAAAGSIIGQITGNSKVTTEKPFLYTAKEEPVYGEAMGMIKIQTDHFRGTIAICFKAETLLKLVNGLGNKNFSSLDGEAGVFAEQLVRLIYAQAKANLIKGGSRVSEGIPQVLSVHPQHIKEFEGHVSIVIPVHSQAGEMHLIASAA